MTGSYLHAAGNVTLSMTFAPAPANDDFANRTALVGQVAVAFSSNITASAESGEPASHGRTVWWRWTAPVSGPACLGTSGSSISPFLAVYTGTELTNLDLVTHGLDRLQFEAVAGTEYQISADANGGYQIQVGQIQLTLTAGLPGNDSFASRLALGGANVTAIGSTVGATREPLEPDHGGYPGSNSIWYSWTPRAVGTLAVTVTGDGFNPTWAVYTGSNLGALGLVTNSYIWLWNVRASGSFAVRPGVPVQIAVDGNAAAGGGPAGITTLNLSFVGLPANDDFANRFPIAGTAIHVAGNTSGATAESGEPDHLGYAAVHSIWWTWTAPATGQATLDSFGSAVTTSLSVYTGTNLANLASVASDNATFAPVVFDCVAGETYQISLDHWYADMYGAVNLNLQFSSVQLTTPTNESVFHAPAEIQLAATNTSWDGELTQVEFIVDDQIIGRAATSPYVFTWTNPPLGDHVLQVVATNTAGIRLTAPAVTVHIRPANDDFADRISLGGSNAVLQVTGVNASLEPGEPGHGPFVSMSVWWSWTASASGTVTLAKPADSSSGYTILAIYTGDSLTNLVFVTNNVVSDTGALMNAVSFTTLPGTDYQIAVALPIYNQREMPITLAFTATPGGDPTAPGPVLSQPERSTAAEFSFRLTGSPGSNYVVLASTNLALPDSNWWPLLSTNLPGNSIIIRDTGATDEHRYYRAKSGP
jgi:hypothetical protein